MMESEITQQIIDVLRDRRGLGLRDLDPDIQAEIKDEIEEIIEAALKASERRVKALEAASPPMSPTQSFVMRMARCMERKLAENRHKGDSEGWRRCDPSDLHDRVNEESDELWDAVHEGKPAKEVWREAADVANTAMMVADAYEHQTAHAGGSRGDGQSTAGTAVAREDGR